MSVLQCSNLKLMSLSLIRCLDLLAETEGLRIYRG
jgi:hypothetical protein